MLYHSYGRYGSTDPADILAGGIALAAVIIVCSAALLLDIFYLISMSRALSRCSPESRKMSPGMVWLMLVPLLGLVWQYMIVDAVSSALGLEFRKRGMAIAAEKPYFGVGLTSCIAFTICALIGWIPFASCLGGPIGIAGLICFVVWWVKVSGMSRELA